MTIQASAVFQNLGFFVVTFKTYVQDLIDVMQRRRKLNIQINRRFFLKGLYENYFKIQLLLALIKIQ